jgi:hypothetical protein
LLPPAQEKIPERDVVVDAAIAIQAFTMNAFGCLDNIAWILVVSQYLNTVIAIRPESGVKPTCQDSPTDAIDPLRAFARTKSRSAATSCDLISPMR